MSSQTNNNQTQASQAAQPVSEDQRKSDTRKDYNGWIIALVIIIIIAVILLIVAIALGVVVHNKYGNNKGAKYILDGPRNYAKRSYNDLGDLGQSVDDGVSNIIGQ